MTEKIKKLIESKNYVEVKRELSEMNEYDIASIIEELPEEEIIKVFRLLPKDIAADVFAYIDQDIQKELITLLTNDEAVHIITNMYADDAVDLLDEMPASVVTKLLSKVSKEKRININKLLKYPDNSAGSLMTVEYVDLKENSTIKDALSKIRTEGNDKSIIDTCYVVDKKRKLIGTVSLKELIFNDPNIRISDIMDDNVIFVNTLEDQEEVSKIFKDYDINVLPVTDNEERLVGVITVDDVIDIVIQENKEDIEKMAGMVSTEKEYLKMSVWEIWKSRIPWLLLLMISATFTGKVIQSYENSLAKYAILTSFIPMIMGTVGNAGGQTSVTIIRGLSLDEIEFKDTFKIIWKEIRAGVIIGFTLAIANFIKLITIDHISVIISFVVCLTLLVTIIIAKIVGCLLPLGAKKVGFDPAVMASPFITTILDTLSLVIFFKIATIILHI